MSPWRIAEVSFPVRRLNIIHSTADKLSLPALVETRILRSRRRYSDWRVFNVWFAWPSHSDLSVEVDPTIMTSDDLSRLSWDDFRIVKAIADSGNLSAAGLALGLNTSTVSRRLTQVETALNTALFERRRMGYIATVAGGEVIALAERLELDIVSVAYRVSGAAQQCAGALKIATTDTLALHLLTPIIADFRKLYPAITIDLLVGNAPLNLSRGEADVALRATDAPPESLFGKRVASIGWAIYACRRAMQSRVLGGLDEQTWVSYGSALSNLKVSNLLDRGIPDDKIACRVDSIEAAAAAIGVNIGIGYLPCLIGEARSDLMRISPIDDTIEIGLWLLTHPEIRRMERVNAFMSFCVSELAKRRGLIEGQDDEAAGWQCRSAGAPAKVLHGAQV